MSKSAISKRRSASKAAVASWQLAQTFWVGGLWLLYFVVLPGLGKIGLAELLVEEVSATLGPLLIAFAAFCACVQVLVLLQAEGLASLWRDQRGQLLLAALALSAVYLSVWQWLPGAPRWLLFNYLLVAFCGVLLVLQPLPGQRATP